MKTNALMLGARASCRGEMCGEVRGIVLDPATRRLSRIIVADQREDRPSRLVPLPMARTDGDTVALDCTVAGFRELEPAPDPRITRVEASDGGSAPSTILYEDEAEPDAVLRPREQARATDGLVGRVCGCATAEDDPRQMTFLLLEVGRFGDAKTVAVPMRSVSSLKTGVNLAMTVSAVHDLPAFSTG